MYMLSYASIRLSGETSDVPKSLLASKRICTYICMHVMDIYSLDM